MSKLPPPRSTRLKVRAGLLELAGSIPYGLGSRALKLALGNPLSRRVLFRNRIRRLRRLYDSMGLPDNDFPSVINRHLSVSHSVPWRINALSRLGDAAFRRWVRVEGEQVLHDLNKAGRPVLLISCHTGLARLAPLVVSRIGIDISAIEPEPYLQLVGARGAERINSIVLRGEGEQFWMKELYQANKLLASGKLVHLALDGHQGRGGVEHAFLGRRRVFHVSMARLAIDLHAAIVFVRALIDDNGLISLCFDSPLDLDETLSSEDRMHQFLDLYVAQIENVWRTNIGNVVTRHLVEHIRSEPIANDGAHNAAGEAREEGNPT